MPRLPIKLKVAIGSKYRFGIKVTVKRNRRNNEETTRNESERSVNDTARSNKPYVGQFWPLQPAMTAPGKHVPKVIVVILGQREGSSPENDQESCYNVERTGPYTPNTVPCLPERRNSTKNNYSRNSCVHCTSQDENLRTYSQRCFLNEFASTNQAFSSEKIPSDRGSTRVVRSGSVEEGRSRCRFSSSTETPLTEEELSALELDINEPLDVLGIMMNRLMKRSCEQ